MIKQEQVIPLILEACPSFKAEFEKSDNKELLYVVMGEFASHLLFLYRQKEIEEFGPLCEVIERLHIDGDSFVKELATIGFLESIQNVWKNNGANPDDFIKFLLPESLKWWKELNDFWNGKIPFVGAGLKNNLNGPN